MNVENHPLRNPQLYAEAESAAQAALEANRAAPRASQVRCMDRAAMTVFRKAGTAPEVRRIFAMSITADIFERARHGGTGG
jgi:hypothetical protein